MTKQTLIGKRATLSLFVRQVGLSDLREFTNEELNAWQSAMLKSGTVSARTINLRTRHVRCFCKWLRDEGHDISLNLNRIYKLKEEPPRRNFFTREEIERAKSHADELTWLLISLTFDSGLRISELGSLRLDDIEGRCIRVVGKGRKRAQLFMSQETYDRLNDWIDEQGISDYLWPSPNRIDQNRSVCSIRLRMRKAFELAGLEGFYPHSLRHSFATELQVNDAPMYVTQRLMRHASIATTERYLHGLDDKKLVDVYDQFMCSEHKESAIA